MAIDLKQRQLVIETLRQLLAEAEAGDIEGFFAMTFQPNGMNVILRHLLHTKDALRIIGSLEQTKFDLLTAVREKEGTYDGRD